MTFSPGDRVHLAGLGTGIVRETRSGGRYAIEIKGRIVVANGRDLERADVGRTTARGARTRVDAGRMPSARGSRGAAASLDLHGRTVAEALEAVEVFVNDALMDGHGEVRIIHGQSGGRVKAAVHQYLRGLASVAAFRVDPRNAGVTIITFA